MEEEIIPSLPIINLSLLHQSPLTKSLAINKIREACLNHGFFHVVNHGIPESVIDEALEVNAKFFEMPTEEEEKKELLSDDVCRSVRYGKVQIEGLSRELLKLYANPLHKFVASWPKSPPQYREKTGAYCERVSKVGLELTGAIMEGLNLGESYLKENLERGNHIIVINNYPQCLLDSNVMAGAAPHTDHSIITILLQSATGLQVIDSNSWKNIPYLKGSLLVLVGNHLEVISNGLYKSLKHRAISNGCENRLSMAFFLSLGMDEIVEPAVKLLNEDNAKRYMGSSFRDFLHHIASNDSKTFIETIEITEPKKD